MTHSHLTFGLVISTVLFSWFCCSCYGGPCTVDLIHKFLVSGGTPNAWGPHCSASVTSDFAHRDLPPQCLPITCGGGSWGPHPKNFSRVVVPSGCDPTRWQEERIVAVLERAVKMSINYCHHHCPNWDSGTMAECSSGGVTLHKKYPTRGVDCSNLSSWVYNFGLGGAMTGATGAQACNPAFAPGVELDFWPYDVHLFRPGDLLYIKGSHLPGRVTHVIHWTNLTMGDGPGQIPQSTLINNTPAYERKTALEWIKAIQDHNLPVHVIVDSHYGGPDYRPYAGWYITAFSHIRRVIESKETATVIHSNVLSGKAKWDPATKECMGVVYNINTSNFLSH
jgi:hypothetical protein